MSVDPVELLDRLRFPEGWSDPVDLDTDEIAADILHRVLAEPHDDIVVPIDAARRRRRVVAAGVVAVALVAGGAVAAIWTRTVDEPRRVACWSEPNDPPEARSFVRWDGVSDPAALCAAEWAAGRFGAPQPAIALQVCVTDAGVAAAVPGDGGVCDSLGLADFSPSFDNPAIAVAQAQHELDRRFNGTTCIPPDQVATRLPAVLDEYGLEAWNITIAGADGADEPCAAVALDIETSTAFISPVPRQG